MSKTKVENIEITTLAQGGDGLGYLPDGRVVFVERALPGDVVDVELTSDKKNWAKGRVVERRTDSTARIKSQCKAFENGCGGCQFWSVDYASELEWKVEAAWETIRRISALDLERPEVIGAPSTRDYRNRITLHQRSTEGDVKRGFYRAKSRQIVEIERCPVARPALDEALQEFGDILAMLGRADITLETAGDEGAVVLIELGKGERIERSDLETIAARIDQAMVVRGVEILDEKGDYYIVGDTTVAAEEVLARPPLKGMRVESGRFRQANQAVNRQMVDHVVDVVDRSWTSPRVMELFCGSGNISFPLSAISEELVGYEGSRGAVETARQMVGLMTDEAPGLRFEVADLEDPEIVTTILAEPFEVLVLDPPRDGAATVANQIARSDRPGQIVYISCDPPCLARDMKTLAGAGWDATSLHCFDMFPRTAHLECVAVMEK